jgi:hypothetical protein
MSVSKSASQGAADTVRSTSNAQMNIHHDCVFDTFHVLYVW